MESYTWFSVTRIRVQVEIKSTLQFLVFGEMRLFDDKFGNSGLHAHANDNNYNILELIFP